jgi:hypothetical protein
MSELSSANLTSRSVLSIIIQMRIECYFYSLWFLVFLLVLILRQFLLLFLFWIFVKYFNSRFLFTLFTLVLLRH